MLGGFDAFDDDLELELVCERDRGPYDGVPGPLRRIKHELLRDLDAVDRETTEIVERRIAGAEIVDRDRNPVFAEPQQDVAMLARCVHEDTFRELKLDRPRRHAGFRQDRPD